MSSLSQPKYKEEYNRFENNTDTQQNAICNLIDIINDNNLSIFYENTDSNFKHHIDQLNLKFYLETEKILAPNNNIDQTENQNKLFLILFKQINLYIKEIERLNTVILQQAKDPQCLKKRMAIMTKQKDNFETKELMIQTLKNTINTLEKKLSQVILSENAIREENEKLKKEIQLYKDKEGSTNTSIFLNHSTNSNTNFNISTQFKRKSKRTYSDNNQSKMNISNNPLNKKEHRIIGRSPNMINSKFYHNSNNNKLKIIKAVKNKFSYSNSKVAKTPDNLNNISMNNIDINSNFEDNSPKIYSPRINCYNLKQTFSNHTNASPANLCSLSFNNNSKDMNENVCNNNQEDSFTELSQIENLLIEIKEHFKKENNYNSKCRSEQKVITIDLEAANREKENKRRNNENDYNNGDTPHFKVGKFNINESINGACIFDMNKH